ncbi:MAG TPA: class I SAM-dependent methyltransferase [Polyangia bacterium]|nr:class I SAM-dependent methyltransferase [Polyangia bacterium]
MKSPFDDAILYDWEYRRRRQDVAFYRLLADERGGPILDAGCGTGRLLVPLARDGHLVVGIDRAPAMLARAAWRLGRAGRPARRRALLARGDLGALPVARGRFALVIAAFHTIQHCESDDALGAFLDGAAAALIPGGWLAFDVFAPSSRFIERRGLSGTTRFRHPRTGRLTAYRESHTLRPGPDGAAKPILEMRFRYSDALTEPGVAERSRRGRSKEPSRGSFPIGGGARARVLSLRHRLWTPAEIDAALARAGLTVIGRWSGFDGAPLGDPADSEQHVYLARRGDPPGRPRAPRRRPR